MEIKKNTNIAEDPLHHLRQFTSARIALGSIGVAIPIKEVLQFRLAHAHARDAVYAQLNEAKLLEQLQQFNLPVYTLHSKATNRENYLQQPGLGRQLSEAAVQQLQDSSAADITIILADGLSATAINKHAVPLMEILLPMLQQAGFTIAPISLVQQGRVAVGDEVASLLKAKFSILLIGERPGLSSPDSLGAYLTYMPKPGLTDERRNCVSNVHAGGLDLNVAAEKILYLTTAAFRLQYSGVSLKDNAGLLGE